MLGILADDINDIVDNLEKMLGRILGEDIDLVVRSASDLGQVKVDPGQIEQVIMNLAVNSRDAMPDGGTLTIETATVTLGADEETTSVSLVPGEYVVLTVADDGEGMTPETRARVFEPFFTTKEKGKGTGLGMSTVYGIVKQSGGDISLHSEVGQGTTFRIFFPTVDAEDSMQRPREKIVNLSGDETVLLVEDEDAVREVIRKMLAAAGYTVLTATNGMEALDVCERHQDEIALVLTDVVMPQMSGRAFGRQVNDRFPRLKVMYMTGYTDTAISHHDVFTPGTKVISKPFTATDLTRRIREALDEV